MMYDQARYFDPTSCPNCRAPLTAPGPKLRCRRCGVLLGSATGAELADLLVGADRTLLRLRQQRDAEPQPVVAPGPTQWTQAGTPNPPRPAVPPIPRTESRWPPISPAAILLSLGGLCLVVAAVVFLSMSWTALTLGPKVAVLGAVTGLLGAGAGYLTRKALRGSAETLWAITFADLGLDVFAARRADLLGLDALPVHLFSGLGAGLVALTAAGCLAATRPVRLIAAQLTLAVAGSTACIALLSDDSLPNWLRLTVAVLTVGALALAARQAGWTVTAITAGGISTLPWLALLGSGLDQIVEGDYAEQLSHGRAWELPAAIVLALVTAAVPSVLRLTWLRIVAATAGLLAFEIMLITAVDELTPWPAALATGLGLAVVAGLVRTEVWHRAMALVVAALAAVTGPVLLVAVVAGLVASLDQGAGLWRSAADQRLTGWVPGATWALLVLLAAAGLAAVRCRPSERGWIAGVAVVSTVAINLNGHPAAWLAIAGWLAAAAVVALIATRPAHLGLAAAAASIGLLSALPSDLNSGWAYGIGALFAALAGRRMLDRQLRTAAELAGLAQLLVAVTAIVHTVTRQDGTPAVAGLLTIAAVSAVTALVSPARRWWQWLAFTCATGAIWIEAAVNQLHAPELYCVPLGVVVLAFGMREARRRELSSWLSYGPGLLILTVPTTVLALAEPLSWRAWAVGAAALGLVLAGARLRRQSPLLIGTFELALVVLREAGPYAMALPRWAGIAAIGLVLLGTGITWEHRLANVKHLRRHLAELS